MSGIRKSILTVAGFDPSGGAGILTDIKTFEQHKLLGFAVQTANTIQTEDNFIEPNWINEEIILKQLNILLQNYNFPYVKIGLIENLNTLLKILDMLLKKNNETRVIWDPVLTSSSGFDFKHDLSDLDQVLEKVYLITPNWSEVLSLSGNHNSDAIKAGKALAGKCNVYLKGSENHKNPGKDHLFLNDKAYNFNPMGKAVYAKHGSGCILSASLTSNLLKGFPMIKACLKSKKYVTRILESNKGLLGYHKR